MFHVRSGSHIWCKDWRRGAQVNKLEITTDKQLLAAAGNPQIRLFEVNSNNPQPVLSFDSHSNNVTAVRAQRVLAVRHYV